MKRWWMPLALAAAVVIALALLAASAVLLVVVGAAAAIGLAFNTLLRGSPKAPGPGRRPAAGHGEVIEGVVREVPEGARDRTDERAEPRPIDRSENGQR